MARLKLVSKFSDGQHVWFIHQMKIVCGMVVGFQSCVHKNYSQSEPRIEVEFNYPGSICDYEMIKESAAFTSKRALLKALE